MPNHNPVYASEILAPDEDGSDAPVLVVVLSSPSERERVLHSGWYRIPLKHAPRQVAADYLAFYRTGAFPPTERWQVAEYASVRGYRLATRRELIPSEEHHPRADDRYYRVDLGPLHLLDRPIPSQRLRRITFIATTWRRLNQAGEINDLWIKSTAQERLWAALKSSGLDVECNYPLDDEVAETVADLAVFGETRRVCIWIDPARSEPSFKEQCSAEYRLAAHNWIPLRVTSQRACTETVEIVAQVQEIITAAGVVR